jgi:hypothetical protein
MAKNIDICCVTYTEDLPDTICTSVHVPAYHPHGLRSGAKLGLASP